MSELPSCPHCGAILWEGPVKHTEEGSELICDTCARSYVYIPGYGSFALSDLDSDTHYEVLDDIAVARNEEFQDSKDTSLTKACLTLCCLLSSIPIVLTMVVLVLLS